MNDTSQPDRRALCQGEVYDRVRKKEPLWGGWKITRYIGSGPQGCVFSMERQTLGRTFTSALKVIPITIRADRPEQMARDLWKHAHELLVLYQLAGHTNVVAWKDHEVFTSKESGDVTTDIVLRMEYLPQTLAGLLEKGPMDWETAFPLILDCLAGLSHIHEQGIVHRGLKPENILLTEAGRAKIGDFGMAAGLAEALDDPDIAGSPLYLAPELMENRLAALECDPRVDLYSMGLLAFHMLEGELPFAKENSRDPEGMARQRMEQDIPDIRADVPENARKAIARALDRDPVKRQDTVLDFQKDLMEAGGASSKRLTTVGVFDALVGRAREAGEDQAGGEGEPFSRMTDSFGMEFILLPAGRFMMGSPETEDGRRKDEALFEVFISRPFFLQTTPVTQAQYEKVMGWNPSRHFQADENSPVESVCADDVLSFVETLNKKEGAHVYDLPTEAQWEYACRAGTKTAFCFGDDPESLSGYAWFDEKEPRPVGQKKENAWGLLDMHGNVMEWCRDCYEPYPSGYVPDHCGPKQGYYGVARGGSFYSGARYCRSACRHMIPRDAEEKDLGFRLIRMP